MRVTRMILLSLVGVVFASASSGLTHVDAWYGVNFNTDPPLYATITVEQHIEQPDLDYWDPDRIDYQNWWRKDGQPITVNFSQGTITPMVAQVRVRHLQFSSASPLPPQNVGDYRVDATFGLMVQYCDTTQNPIECIYYPTCAAENGEPCYDMAEGYIQ